MKNSSFLRFFQMTSLHGWSFFTHRNFNVADCIFWSAVVITSMIVCAISINQYVHGKVGSLKDFCCSKNPSVILKDAGG